MPDRKEAGTISSKHGLHFVENVLQVIWEMISINVTFLDCLHLFSFSQKIPKYPGKQSIVIYCTSINY